MCCLIALKTLAVKLLGDRLYTKSALYTRMSLFIVISHRKSRLHYIKFYFLRLGRVTFILMLCLNDRNVFSRLEEKFHLS